MKKRYTLFLCITFLSISGIAQHYYPMLDSVNEWMYVGNQEPVSPPPHQMTTTQHCNYPLFIPVFSYEGVYTNSDTVITALTYKKLFTLQMHCLYGYIREDTAARKVYFMDNQNHAEVLLYDFSMQIHDSIALSFQFAGGSGYSNGVYRLDSIKTIHVLAGNRRHFFLNKHTGSAGNDPLEWVESIGNLIDNVYPFGALQMNFGPYAGVPGYQHRYGQFLTCFHHSKMVYYDSAAFIQARNQNGVFTDTCNYRENVGIHESSALASLSAYPNPTSGQVTLQLTMTKAQVVEIRVTDMTGRQVVEPTSLGILPEGIQEKTFDISSLPPGMYFVEFRNKEGRTYLKLMVK
jgi:hypothetical protein